MHTLHIAMLVIAMSALVVLAVGSGRPEGSTESRRARSVALLTGGALVVGNVVSLLPGTPAWYSTGLLALTAAGLVWALIAALPSQAPAVRPAARPVRPSGRPLYAAAVPGEIVDAEIVDAAPVASIVRERPRRTVTAAQIRSAGPDPTGATQGQTYVAAALGDYLGDDRSSRAGRGSDTWSRRRHGAPATDDAAATRLRVLRAYGATGDLRGRLRSSRD